MQHKVDTRDAQPTGDGHSLVVLVTGMLLVDDGQNPLKFSQVCNARCDLCLVLYATSRGWLVLCVQRHFPVRGLNYDPGEPTLTLWIV